MYSFLRVLTVANQNCICSSTFPLAKDLLSTKKKHNLIRSQPKIKFSTIHNNLLNHKRFTATKLQSAKNYNRIVRVINGKMRKQRQKKGQSKKIYIYSEDNLAIICCKRL